MLALSFGAHAQELPFVFFAQDIPASGELLAFQQNSNKEIQLVSIEGVDIYNGRKAQRRYSFSRQGIQNLQQALFTGHHTILVLTSDGLYLVDVHKGEKEKIREGRFDKIFYDPQQQKLYASMEGGLFLLEEKGVSRKVHGTADGAREIVFGEKEMIVVGRTSLAFYSSNWSFKETISLQEPIIDSYYSNERLFVLTRNAVFSKETGAGLKKYHSFEGEQASCILEDQAGRLWIGTKSSGLLLIDGNQHKTLSEQHNFPLKGVKGIYESPDFAVWFYGEEGITFKPFSAPFQKYKLGRHLSGEHIKDVYPIDSIKTALLTADGYYHIVNDEGLLSTKHKPVPFVPAFSQIIKDEKLIHVGAQGELLFLDKGKKAQRSLKMDIRQLFAFDDQSILLDSKGSMYGYDHNTNGIVKKGWEFAANKTLFKSGRFLVYTHPGGEIKKWSSKDRTHTLIAQDPGDVLFAALFQQEHFVYISKKQEVKYALGDGFETLDFRLPENEQASAFSVSDRFLWISTQEKLYQIGLVREGDRLAVSETRVFNAKDYAIQLPLLAGIEKKEGKMLLSSGSSFLLYDPLAMAPDVSPPGLFVEKVSIQHKDALRHLAFDQQDSLKVDLAANEQLIIKAFAIQHGQNNKASLQYRFLSSADQWKQALGNELIIISGLEAGHHILELASENEQGVKSRKRFFLLLSVSQASSYSWWAILGASLSLMLFGYFAYNGIRSVKEGKGREAKERYEKELLKLQRKSHEQMMKAEGLKQVNELISAQKTELEDKNKQIVAQKYELSLTNNQIKQQKDLILKTSEKLQNSINYAKRIQTALMGDEIMIKEDLTDSFVFFKPRDQVSGDFFWFIKSRNELQEEVLIIAAVDCTGHGVPGAIVSVVGIQLLNAIVNAKGITDPGQILSELNSDLLTSLNYEQTKINDGMDMSLCTINLKRQKLFYAGAKNPLYIIENGELEIIKGDKQAIGGRKLKEDKVFQTHEIPLKGEGKQMFYLFSDGYEDQFGGPDQSKFMSSSFKKLLLEIHEKPMIEQKYVLAKTLSEWQGEQDQTDDILVLGFRI